MKKDIRVLTNLRFGKSAMMIRDFLDTFPENPELGTDCVVKGMHYIYTEIDGQQFWMPSGIRRSKYIHNQDIPSSTWEIQHNLNTYEVVVSVYDAENRIMNVGYQLIDDKSLKLEFTHEVVGKVIVFGTVGEAIDDGYSIYTPLRAIREVKVNLDLEYNPNVINLNAANLFTKTISAATTLSVINITTIQNTVNTFILELTNGGNFTISWWENIKWDEGKTPELTKDGTDILGFYTHDGVNWRGIYMSKDIK